MTGNLSLFSTSRFVLWDSVQQSSERDKAGYNELAVVATEIYHKVYT